MADDKKLAARLDEMIEARWAALRTQARRDAAMALIEGQGSATNAEIEEQLSTHMLPSRNELLDSMARKAESRVENAEYSIEIAERMVEVTRARREELLAQAETFDVEAAEAELEQVRGAVGEAQELAEYTRRLGDPNADQAGAPAQADAESAGAGAKSGS